MGLCESSKRKSQEETADGPLKVSEVVENENLEQKKDRLITTFFHELDQDNSGTLDFKEVRALLRKLNANMPKSEVKSAMANHAKVPGQLELQEFTTFYHSIRSIPKALHDVWAQCGGETADPKGLAAFFAEVQGEEIDVSRAAELIADAEGNEDGVLSEGGFERLLLDLDLNLAWCPDKRAQVYHDMSLPLSHYFIASSHNTYLSGDQLKDPATTEAIRSALLRGVRVIELDAWNGEDGQPKVYHGGTLTAPISFRDAVSTICESGFAASPWLVIITIENHCSEDQMRTQAAILREELGDKLWVPPGDMKEFPSPAELKGRVVIRDKPLGHNKASKSVDEKEASGEQVVVEVVDSNGEGGADGAPALSRAKSSTDDEGEDEVETKNKGKKAKVMPAELLRLVLVRNVKVRDWAALPADPSSASFNENKIKKIGKKHPLALRSYTHRHLARVYPKGLRVGSSSYDPAPAWALGCQLVALNFQRYNRPICLHLARFADNGGAGYCLKPACLMDPAAPPLAGRTKEMRLTVEVLSGHYLPKPRGEEKGEIIDPYVRVEISGAPQDEASFKTRHIDDNGWNPTWNKKSTFDIAVPELALVRFVVKDHDVVSKNDFIGDMALPVGMLRTGYRLVPLRGHNGRAIPRAFLFVKIGIASLTTPAEDEAVEPLADPEE